MKSADKRTFDGEEYTLHSFRKEKNAQSLKKTLKDRGLKVRTVKSKEYGTRGVYYRKK